MGRAALTGGIATGKSYCLSRFAALGAAVIDADVLPRSAVSAGSPGLARVVERFGPGVLHGDGDLDRSALARIVFADRVARADLEAIVHPEVYRRVSEWFADLPAGTGPPLPPTPPLFRPGRPPAEQLRRAIQRDALSEADARARIASQWPIEEKVKRAHHVIRTDGSFAE